MAVAQPDFLLVFNESSGTAVTNYGTQASGYTIQGSGSSPTDYEWNQQALSPTAGYLDLKTVGGGSANLPYLTTAATAPSTGQQPLCLAIGFKIDGWDTVLTRSYLVSSGPAQVTAGFCLTVQPPAGSGDFDLHLEFRTGGGFGWGVGNRRVMSALTFGTLYQLAACGEFSGADMTLRYKLNSNAVITPAAQSNGSDGLSAVWPYLNNAQYEGFNDYGGINGQLYYFALDRNGAVWSDTDLGDINSNPATAITGWPTSGGPDLTEYGAMVGGEQSFVGQALIGAPETFTPPPATDGQPTMRRWDHVPHMGGRRRFGAAF
jgi:hypothetical protein